MNRNTFHVNELCVGRSVRGCLLLKTAKSGVTRNGNPYLSATLADITGEIAAVVWDNTSGITSIDAGRIVQFCGDVGEYDGKPQLVINPLTLALVTNEADIQVVREDLIPVAPEPIEDMADYLIGIINFELDPDDSTICKELILPIINEFKTMPAAMHVHHSFAGGLLMHTLNIALLARDVADQYGDRIDRSLLITGAILHDYGKMREYIVSETGLVSDYTTEGQLIGHPVIGAMELAKIAEKNNIPKEKSMLLQHMLLSHHGEPEFGAAVRPAIIEAEILARLDMLDSRIEIYFENLKSVEANHFSEPVWALDKRKIFNHEEKATKSA